MAEFDQKLTTEQRTTPSKSKQNIGTPYYIAAKERLETQDLKNRTYLAYPTKNDSSNPKTHNQKKTRNKIKKRQDQLDRGHQINQELITLFLQSKHQLPQNAYCHKSSNFSTTYQNNKNPNPSRANLYV